MSKIIKNFNPQKPMATPQEFLLPCEKNNGSLKSCLNECVSCRKTKPLWCILFFRYSELINLFSEERIPLTLLEIKLPIVLDITSFFDRQ